MTRTIGIFACAAALLTGCYESYFAVPDGDWDVFHRADDASGDTRDRGADGDADVEADATAHDDAEVGSDAPCEVPENRALRFRGNQYVEVPDSPGLAFTDLTLEAWVRFAFLPDCGHVVAKPLGSDTSDSFVLWYQEGDLCAGVVPTTPADSLGWAWAPGAEEWHHLAFTYDSSSQAQTLFIDGIRVDSARAPRPLVYDEHPLLIGADMNWGTLGWFLDGDIDELRVWTSVRPIEELGHDMRSCEPGPVAGLGAYYSFDEGTGQVANDDSGNGNDGRLGSTPDVDENDPTWIVSDVPFR